MASTELSLSAAPPGQSLRAKIALGVALPIFLILLSFSLIHYGRERHLIETHVESVALQLGQTTLSSVRHAMLKNDDRLLAEILSDMSRLDNIRQIQIIDLDGRVKANSLGRQLDQVQDRGKPGCVECHDSDPSTALPTPFGRGLRRAGSANARTVRLAFPSGSMRVSLPIRNEPACVGCHAREDVLLGTLLVDVAITDLEQRLLDDLRVDLLFSTGITVLATLGIYVLIHRLVVRRIGALRRPLAEFAQGDFGLKPPDGSARLPVALRPSDEIDALTEAFNHMAVQLQRHAREQEERAEVRQRAIVEERERIARELHDGMAQLLGYVSTKAMAVRLMLKNRQVEAAQKHLAQLEEAAQEVFVDVREAILGLKLAGQNGQGLAAALREFTAQYSRLSGIPVDLSVAPGAEHVALPAETEMQLARIVQEALTNVRKHATASRACVCLRHDDGFLELTVRDDGVGFAPGQAHAASRSHFGLSTMRERAAAIGADFTLDAEPGAGTCIRVGLKVEEQPSGDLRPPSGDLRPPRGLPVRVEENGSHACPGR